MTITNAQSNSGVETSSKAWDGWCGSQPIPSISYMPLRVALSAIRHWKASIPQCTPQTSGGRHRQGEISDDNHVAINVNSTLGVGDTLVRLIVMSDGTHLSIIAANNKEWLEYVTIRNLSSKIRQMPSMNSVVMVALLLIPIKNDNIQPERLDEKRQTNRKVRNEVLQRVLQPLTFKQNPSTESGYYNVPCADENFRHSKPVIAASLADCPEYSNLHHLERHVWTWCECSNTKPGDYVPPDKQHPRWDHNKYWMLSDANTKAADAEASSRHRHCGFNAFRHIPCIMSDLPTPDLLQTIEIGMLDHLQRWIYLEALVRSPEVSGRIPCCFQSNLHRADEGQKLLALRWCS